MEFIKMHGAGNDYIFIDCLKEEISDPEILAVEISDRHFGVGGDGLVLILPSDVAHCKMRMFNNDGSEGKMCGNAIRCVGKYYYENISSDTKNIVVETLSGNKTLKLTVNRAKVDNVTVDMGKADFLVQNVPFICSEDEFVDMPIVADDKEFRATVLSMGNPHCVIFVDNIDTIDILRYGEKIEYDDKFPDRVNVEFAQILDKNTIRVRVWERGSGETLACGTGACAVVASAVRLGLVPVDTKIAVNLTGGQLSITSDKDYNINMEGGAVEVFRGNYNTIN